MSALHQLHMPPRVEHGHRHGSCVEKKNQNMGTMLPSVQVFTHWQPSCTFPIRSESDRIEWHKTVALV